MMRKTARPLACAALALALLATACSLARPKYTPKLTMEQAREVALQAVPGATVKSEELEREKGRWVYSFDLVKGGAIREVWVDPESGAVLQDEPESAAQEAKEKH